MPSPYWQAQVAPFQQGVGSLTAGLTRLPMIQAQGAMLNQRAGLYGQEATEAAARTGLIGAQTDEANSRVAELAQKGALVEALQKYAPAAQAAMAAGKLDDPSIDAFTGADSALTGVNKGDIQKSFATGLGTILARGGNVSGAAAVENPVSVSNNAADNATKAARPVVVPTGGTLMDPTGTPLGAGGVTLNPGQNRFGPQSLAGALSANQTGPADVDDPSQQGGEMPAPPLVAQGQPLPVKPVATKAPPQLPASVLAPLFKQALANSQGGTNTESAVQAVLDANAKVAPPAGAPTAGPAMVRVKHPNGQTGTIPTANLQAALKAGYQQIQ